MDELKKLEYLSLVSKITNELYNHTGRSDKILAEYIIDLYDQSKDYESFHDLLKENGAKFPVSFVENIHRLCSIMRPSEKETKVKPQETKEQGREEYSALTIPDDPKWNEKIDENSNKACRNDDESTGKPRKSVEN